MHLEACSDVDVDEHRTVVAEGEQTDEDEEEDIEHEVDTDDEHAVDVEIGLGDSEEEDGVLCCAVLQTTVLMKAKTMMGSILKITLQRCQGFFLVILLASHSDGSPSCRHQSLPHLQGEASTTIVRGLSWTSFSSAPL